MYSATPAAVSTVAHRLENEWPYGARFESFEPLCNGHLIAQCVATDGGRWFVGSDKYGVSFVHGETRAEVMDLLTAAWRAMNEVK